MNFDFFNGNLIYIFVSLVIAITLHEMMHAYTSHWLGDDTAHDMGRVSLNPLRHVDLYTTILLPLITIILFKFPILAAKPVPFNPSRVKWEEFGAALVGLAGPFTNLLLAIVTAGFLRVAPVGLDPSLVQFLAIFLQVNVGLFVFNMIPIPPLDGSRLLYALVPESVQEAMASLERYGIIIVFALVLLVPAFNTLYFNLNTYILRILL